MKRSEAVTEIMKVLKKLQLNSGDDKAHSEWCADHVLKVVESLKMLPPEYQFELQADGYFNGYKNEWESEDGN